MLTLVLALALADAPRSSAARPAHRPKPAPGAPAKAPLPRPVKITSVEPLNVTAGQRVTVTGSGFDQGSVVLLGETAPNIVERSDGKLVFVAPYDPRHPESYQLRAFLVTPGNTVAGLGELNVTTARAATGAPGPPLPAFVPVPGGPMTLVDEKFPLSASAPKSYRLDMEGANAVSITLACTGGEADVEVKPEQKDEPVVKMSTEDGQMRRAVQQRQMHAPDAPPLGPILVRFTTPSTTPLGCTLKIGRTPLPK